MKSTGDRASWLTEIADQIMDGGDNPPSIDRLYLTVPDRIVTAINDGHNTAAAAFGEKKRNDYRAGQRVIIQEMVTLLREQAFVGGDDAALRWLQDHDGEWHVNVGDRQFLIRGQRERRLGKERYLLGERDEETGDRIGLAGILEAGKSRPFEVEVLSPRGKTKHVSYQVHELAFMFPPMTESERETLRASIAQEGVKVPLEIFEGKVIDGRNRLYFASVLKKPVHIKEFIGTYDEAKKHIVSLNLARRHLNNLQRAVMVNDLYGIEAKRKAAEALERGRVSGGESHFSSRPNLDASIERKRWHEIAAAAANKDGWNVTPASVREAAEIVAAPQTKAAVERGDITVADRAKRRARTEKGKTQRTPRDRNGEYILTRLGSFIEFQISVLETDEPIARTISERLDQIDRLNSEVRRVLRQRLVIR